MEHDIPTKVKTTVLEIEPEAEVILYGSRARNDYRETSDWDFLILVHGRVDSARTDRIRAQLYDIELDSGEIISSIVRSREEWNGAKYLYAPFRENIAREGMRV